MKLFLTKTKLDDYAKARAFELYGHKLDAAASRGAKEAVHYYFCWRTIDWWRKQLDKAEKKGNKYVTFAELVTEVHRENKHKGLD